MGRIRSIEITTGGGEPPGLNAVIRSLVLSSLRGTWEIIGIRKGEEGGLS